MDECDGANSFPVLHVSKRQETKFSAQVPPPFDFSKFGRFTKPFPGLKKHLGHQPGATPAATTTADITKSFIEPPSKHDSARVERIVVEPVANQLDQNMTAQGKPLSLCTISEASEPPTSPVQTSLTDTPDGDVFASVGSISSAGPEPS